jgi:hypothetical protein
MTRKLFGLKWFAKKWKKKRKEESIDEPKPLDLNDSKESFDKNHFKMVENDFDPKTIGKHLSEENDSRNRNDFKISNDLMKTNDLPKENDLSNRKRVKNSNFDRERDNLRK